MEKKAEAVKQHQIEHTKRVSRRLCSLIYMCTCVNVIICICVSIHVHL